MQSANVHTWDHFYITCDPPKEKRKVNCHLDQVKIMKVEPRAKQVSEDVCLGYNFSIQGVYCFCNKYKGKWKYLLLFFKKEQVWGEIM